LQPLRCRQQLQAGQGCRPEQAAAEVVVMTAVVVAAVEAALLGRVPVRTAHRRRRQMQALQH